MSIFGFVGPDGYRHGVKIGNDMTTITPQFGVVNMVRPLVVTPFGVFQSSQYQPQPTAIIVNNHQNRDQYNNYYKQQQQKQSNLLNILSSLKDEDEDVAKPIIIGGAIKHYVMTSSKSKPVYDRDGDLIDYKL